MKSTIFANGEGQKIRARRKALKMRQYQVAEKAGCSRQLVSKIERGDLWNSKLREKIIRVLQLEEEKNLKGFIGCL